MTYAISNSTTGTGPRDQSRGVNITLWVLQVVAAATFVFAALPKVTANPQAVAGFAEMGLGTVGMYVIGILEIAGAIGLLIPRLSGLAGLAFIGLMVGAVLTTLLLSGASAVAFPAAVLVLVAIIAWGRRRTTATLLSTIRPH